MVELPGKWSKLWGGVGAKEQEALKGPPLGLHSREHLKWARCWAKMTETTPTGLPMVKIKRGGEVTKGQEARHTAKIH